MKKKILFIITKSVWGGAGRYIYDLATNLPRERFETVVAAGGSGPLFDALAQREVRTICIPYLDRDIHLWSEFRVLFSLISIIKKERPHVIHLNSSKIGGLGAMAGRIAGILGGFRPRIVFTAHGWGFYEDRSSFPRLCIHLATRIASFFQDAIIVISKKDIEGALGITAARKVAFIPNGILPPIFLPRETARTFLAKRIKRQIPENAIVVGTIAEYTKNKGLSYFLEAINIVSARHPIIAFLIGDGENRIRLTKQIKHFGLEEDVILTGFIPDAVRMIRAFDIFVLPSVKEGHPYTLLEAMAAQLPVIATDVGGIPDTIEDRISGILVPPKNPQAIADALRELMHDKRLCDSLGKAAGERIRTHYPLHAMIEKTISIYAG